jgi:hypothetical protein
LNSLARKDYKPKGKVLLEMLKQIKVMLLHYSDRTERVLTDNADKLACRVVVWRASTEDFTAPPVLIVSAANSHVRNVGWEKTRTEWNLADLNEKAKTRPRFLPLAGFCF